MTENNSVTRGGIYSLTLRWWPEVSQMDRYSLRQALETMVQFLYLLPFTVVALAWLLLRTEIDRLSINLDALAVLFVATVLLLFQPFTVRIRLDREGDELHIKSSLAPMLVWAALFISGATGLWALVLAAITVAFLQSRQLAGYDQNRVWKPLSFIVQQVSLFVFPALIAATIYLAFGGAFPVTGSTRGHWLLALAAIIAGALLSGLLLIPVAVQMNSLDKAPNSAGKLARFYASAVALPLLMSPFAIVIAILDTEGETFALIFIVIGVYLVNRLAHHMSMAEARSRRQARELEQLERLAKRIIEAPADASTLPDVLGATMPKLFPTDRVAIHVFEPHHDQAWTPFDLQHPRTEVGVGEETWTTLYTDEASYRLLSKATLPGQSRTFGDALLAKIFVEGVDDDQEAAECVGGVYLLRHTSVGSPLDSLGAVESLASQIGTALDRAQNHAEMLAFHKAQQELEFAGRIQTSFLPADVPQADNWQISATLISARQTSGDFYDFIPLDNGLIGLVVADVSDKGTGAALYMALSRTLLRTYAMESGTQPEVALTRANERVRADTETDQFVTLIYGVLDPESGLLTYANAGHNPGYLLRAGNGQYDSLTKTGIPLGMFKGMEWQQAQVQFEPGDLLILYTDGVTEAQNLANEEYGDDRLLSVGSKNIGRPASEVQEAIIAAIEDFVGEAPQFDDVTLMVVYRVA